MTASPLSTPPTPARRPRSTQIRVPEPQFQRRTAWDSPTHFARYRGPPLNPVATRLPPTANLQTSSVDGLKGDNETASPRHRAPRPEGIGPRALRERDRLSEARRSR